METYVVADIGGTQIRAAVFQTGNPNPLIVKKIRTKDKLQSTTERLIGLFKEVWPNDQQVKAIVVAVPGYLDKNEGIVFEARTVPGLTDLQSPKLLEQQFHVPSLLGNDANLAAI